MWMKNTCRNVSYVQLQYCIVDTNIILGVRTNLYTHYESISVSTSETAKEGRTREPPLTEGEEVTEKADCRGGWGALGKFHLASILPFPTFLSVLKVLSSLAAL